MIDHTQFLRWTTPRRCAHGECRKKAYAHDVLRNLTDDRSRGAYEDSGEVSRDSRERQCSQSVGSGDIHTVERSNRDAPAAAEMTIVSPFLTWQPSKSPRYDVGPYGGTAVNAIGMLGAPPRTALILVAPIQLAFGKSTDAPGLLLTKKRVRVPFTYRSFW